jgi:hypothetical protein
MEKMVELYDTIEPLKSIMTVYTGWIRRTPNHMKPPIPTKNQIEVEHWGNTDHDALIKQLLKQAKQFF